MVHNFEGRDTKTAQKIPDTLVPAREGDRLLILIPNYWGRGDTIADAKTELIKQRGNLNGIGAPKAWRVYSVHPDTRVGPMGGMVFPQDAHPPMLIASTKWPVE